MDRKYSIEELRQVKGIGKKTIQRIVNQFDDSQYISKYDPSIHIEPNSLIHGDMLEKMNGIPDKSVDLILTDLPYGTTRNSWDEIIPLDKMWKQYRRVVKDNGVIVLFGSEPFSTKLRNSNLSEYKYDWYWDKHIPSGMLNAKKQPMRQIETISVFYKNQPTYNPQMVKRDLPIKAGGNNIGTTNYNEVKQIGKTDYEKTYEYKYPITLIKFNKIRQGSLHPTQKPVELLEYLIKTYTNENDIVLDSTMGSGSTCVAAVNTNRRYIGIELDQDYYNVAVERVEKAKG